MLLVPPPSLHRYVAQAVNFDGSDDYALSNAALTGVADSKLLTGSVWLWRGEDGVNDVILYGTVNPTSTLQFNFQTQGNRILIQARDSAQSIELSVNSAVDSILVANGWQHIMFSFDMSDTGKQHLYVDNVSSLVVGTYNDDTLSFTSAANWAVGATTAGGNDLTGDMADLLVWFGAYADLSAEANRRLFISAQGKPVNPGAAFRAFGVPDIALYGPKASWHVNKGKGGGFTVTGDLAAVNDGPSA